MLESIFAVVNLTLIDLPGLTKVAVGTYVNILVISLADYGYKICKTFCSLRA